MFKVHILTIFPSMFPGVLGESLAGRALGHLWSLNVVDISAFGVSKHKNVDDIPYGGGSGMVMRPDVLGAALDYTLSNISTNFLTEPSNRCPIYYMSPRGKVFDQKYAHYIQQQNEIVIVCGRFEGIDERVIEAYNMIEVSIGDFVLSGGEVAALAMLDACIRLIPGVMSNDLSGYEESFANTVNRGNDIIAGLEYPLYTRPSIWRNMAVPDVLLSGHHAKIREWKMAKSHEITMNKRPDLF